MSRIEISLSDSARVFAEAQVVDGVYRDLSAYFDALIVREAQQRAEIEAIDAKLLEALEHPGGVPLTPQIWDQIERAAGRRLAEERN